MSGMGGAGRDAAGGANEVRGRVVRMLGDYVALALRQRAFEELFRVRVLHAGYQLREVVEERRRLAAECDRIRAGIARGAYRDAAEVAADARRALVPPPGPDAGADADPDADPDAAPAPGAATFGRPADDAGLDESTRRRILREFRRIVLPGVHADTSDAPFEAFDAAHAAYRVRDYVLMESFVIRHRGELGRAEAADRLAEYRAAAGRLRHRLGLLRAECSPAELADDGGVRRRIEERSREIGRAIDAESEQVLRLRGYLTTLVDRGRLRGGVPGPGGHAEGPGNSPGVLRNGDGSW
ncbi:hypothetical protein [Streptomyces sp. B6B3]|uniref:hypothetical protein n=1 Tax=Streptomyces sp. B6B3 TaxID=3153570 RepID=UPI00325CED9A